MKNKEILNEIQKIKSLMGFSIDMNSGGLIKEGFLDDTGGMNASAIEGPDEDELRYPIYTMGLPSLNGDYKSFNQPLTRIMGPKDGSGPNVFYIGKDMDWQKLFPSKKIMYGAIVDKLGNVHTNQPYILSDDKKTKLCLPDNNWLEKYKQLNLVYMFQNPKTGKYYSLKFQTWAQPRPFGPQKVSTEGIVASQFCYGGDNGWEFAVNNVTSKKGALPPFSQLGTDIYWDISDPAQFDPRSDDDIFWDKYGLTIEIIVGVAVAFLAPGIGSLIVGLVEGGLIGGAFGSLVTGLAGVGYGASNMLIISIEILSEAGLLLPYAMNQISRGNGTSAGIMMLFCLLPFATELKSVHSWLSKGVGAFAKSDVDLLLKNVDEYGGWEKIFSMTDTELQVWKMSLDKGQQDVLEAGMQMIKNMNNTPNAIPEFSKFVADVYNKNADVIIKKAQQKGFTETEKAVADITDLIVGLMPTAVLSGKGLIAQLGRGFLTIGPVAIGLQKLADKITEQFPNETEEWRLEQMKLMEKVFQEEGGNPQETYQFKIMAELYGKMGWEIGKDNLATILADTTEVMKTDEYKNASSEIKQDLIAKKLEELSKKKNDETLKETVEVFVNNKEQLILLVDLANIIKKETEIFEIITTKLGFINFNWKNGTHPENYSSDWNFTINESTNTNKLIDGKIVFDQSLGTFEIYLLNRTNQEEKIYPEKSTPTNKVTFDKKG